MNAEWAYKLIKDIEATGSRLEKERMLKQLASEEIGRFLIERAYNPFVTYGLKPKLATRDFDGIAGCEFRVDDIAPLLDDLAARRLTGRAAEREVYDTMMDLNEVGAYLLFLVLSKDLKCGIAEATINIAVPGLIPSFGVMRAHAFEERKVKWPMKIEPKLDGQRNTFLCKNGQGAFFTRSGKVVPALEFLVEPVLEVARHAVANSPVLCEVMTGLRSFMGGETQLKDISFMLDGEAMMGLFKDTGALRRKDAQAIGAELHLYDMMPYADFVAVGAVGEPLRVRRRWLEEFVRIAHCMPEHGRNGPLQIVPQYFVNGVAEVDAFFEQMLAKPLATYLSRGNVDRYSELMGITTDPATGEPKCLEGAMVKDPDGLYEKRKCHGWMKLKAEETEDLVVIGAFPGEPHTKYENSLGGLIVKRDGVEVRVGGGFSDAQRDEIWAQFQKDVFHYGRLTEDRGGTKGIVFTAFPTDVTGIIERLIEVKFHEVTPDGSLRHPRFVRFRDDKEGEKAA